MDAAVRRQLLAPQAHARRTARSSRRARCGPSTARTPRATASPLNTTDTSSDASGAISTWLRSQGWYSRAASRPSNSPSSDHDLLAAPPLLRRACRGTRSRPRTRRGRRRARSPRPRPTPPSCCARSRGRGRAARRTRRGSPIRGPSVPMPPASRPRTAVARLPAGCSTANPWPADRPSATQPAAWISSNAGSGLAWIRCDRSRISSRAASTASAARALTSANGLGGAGVDAGRHGTSVGDGAGGPSARRRASTSATMKIAARNSTIGSWNASTRRRTTSAATNRPTHAPRRAARVQSPW